MTPTRSARIAAESSGFGPTSESRRVQTLDVLRGLAIFGILFVNILMIGLPVAHSEILEGIYGGVLDRIAVRATQFFIQGKFYSLFSLLFGVGVAIQFDRALDRGRRFGPWYCRRLLVLLAIGLVHDLLIWNGTILITYALVGFGLLPFVKRQPRILLIWTALLLLVPVLVATVYVTVIDSPDPKIEATEAADSGKAAAAADEAERQQAYEQEVALYKTGSYLDQLEHRLGKLLESLGIILALGWYVLGLFLIGLLLWRSGLFTEPANHLRTIRRLLGWGLVVGLPFTGAVMAVRMIVEGRPATPILISAFTAQQLGNVALCLGYVAAVMLAMLTATGRHILSPLAPVGRTALSNYILQSLVCTTIFYSPGLGLYGSIGPALCLLLAVAIFTGQLVLSAWWVRRFRFGPAEWLWRALSYGQRLPLRRARTPMQTMPEDG